MAIDCANCDVRATGSLWPPFGLLVAARCIMGLRVVWKRPLGRPLPDAGKLWSDLWNYAHTVSRRIDRPWSCSRTAFRAPLGRGRTWSAGSTRPATCRSMWQGRGVTDRGGRRNV